MTFSENTFKNICVHIAALTLILSPMLVFSAGTGLTGGSGTSVGGGSGTSLDGGGGNGKFSNPLGGDGSLSGLLDKMLKVVVQIGAIVVVFFYIYAGFRYVWARGDPGAIKTATGILTWTTVGAMVLLGAQVIATAIHGTVQQISSGK